MEKKKWNPTFVYFAKVASVPLFFLSGMFLPGYIARGNAAKHAAEQNREKIELVVTDSIMAQKTR